MRAASSSAPSIIRGTLGGNASVRNREGTLTVANIRWLKTIRAGKLRGRRAGEHRGFLGRGEAFPMAGLERCEVKSADTHADQAQRGVADGGGHASDLAVTAFDEFEGDPAIGNGFPHANGRVSGRDCGLGVEQPSAAGEGGAALNEDATAEAGEGFRGGDAFDLDPVLTRVGVFGLEEPLIPVGFVAEEEETFGVGVEAADGVDAGWELEFGEIAVWGTVGGELGENAPRFMEGDEHGGGWRRLGVGVNGTSGLLGGMGEAKGVPGLGRFRVSGFVVVRWRLERGDGDEG